LEHSLIKLKLLSDFVIYFGRCTSCNSFCMTGLLLQRCFPYCNTVWMKHSSKWCRMVLASCLNAAVINCGASVHYTLEQVIIDCNIQCAVSVICCLQKYDNFKLHVVINIITIIQQYLGIWSKIISNENELWWYSYYSTNLLVGM